MKRRPAAAPPSPEASIAALVNFLAGRRKDILEAWRAAVNADPELTTSDGLSRRQLLDHIPQVLTDFEHRLLDAGRPLTSTPVGANIDNSLEHGQHRWQHGYDLREVILEWGLLHCCVIDALDAAQAALPEIVPQTFILARRCLAGLVSNAIADSTDQFARLQQKEAIRERAELESAVARFIEDGARRVSFWRDSSHDIRGLLSLITSATAVVRDPTFEEPMKEEALEILQRGALGLKDMLSGVMEAMQVDESREERRLAAFDAGTLLGNLCASSQPLARERRLYLRTNGPGTLAIEGDAGKVQRIAQNLLLNGLTYTASGGVTISWGEVDDDWWRFEVSDTGPGLPAEGTRPDGPRGEGIGLSIVRRLSDLLGGQIEVKTGAEGTRFAVTLPRRYAG